ncbi:hypothetical protein Hanom_Chr13g01243211 [Helianthus anomalus]
MNNQYLKSHTLLTVSSGSTTFHNYPLLYVLSLSQTVTCRSSRCREFGSPHEFGDVGAPAVGMPISFVL